MIMYGINLVSLVEEIRDADPTLLSPFYADDAEYDGLARQSRGETMPAVEPGSGPGIPPNDGQVALYIRKVRKYYLRR